MPSAFNSSAGGYSRNVLDNLARYTRGEPVDRVALALRRRQMPQGGQQQPRPPSAPQPAQRTQSTPFQNSQERSPTLAQQLMAGAMVAPTGGPVRSIMPSGDDWIALSDLPAEIQGARMPDGYGLAGFQPSTIKDPRQRALLDRWVAIARQRKDAQLAQQARTDPNFQKQIAMLPPEE